MSQSAAVPGPISGVERLSEREARFQRRAILFLTVIPLVGLVVAVASLWGWGITGADAAIALAMYVIAGLGITVGYHRLFTHKSFDAPAPVRALFALTGSLAVEGSVISWVATHRRHHAYADKDGDPHSPHLSGDGIGGVLRGLWHAHVGWLFDADKTAPERWAPDLLKERIVKRIDGWFPIVAVSSFALPAVLGLALTGSAVGALRAFLWGGLARIFLLHHITWSVNSICHYYGKRPFGTKDESTNNWPLAILSFGESWHNNHHAFPTSAVHGIGRWQPDPSAFVISTLERLGLARNVKRVGGRQLERKMS